VRTRHLWSAIFVLASLAACSGRTQGTPDQGKPELAKECETYLAANERCLSSLSPGIQDIAHARTMQAREALLAETRQPGGAELARRSCVDNLARLSCH
jgi:hypothetical protein